MELTAETIIIPSEVINGGTFRPAPLEARFDQQLIAPHVQDAELKWTLPLLGDAMYQDMINTKFNGVSNYNPKVGTLQEKFPNDANYEKLWTQFLLSFTGKSVFLQSLPFLSVQTATKGLIINDTSFGEGQGLDVAKNIKDSTTQTLEMLKGRIIQFLCKNKGDYPLFDDCNCKCHETKDCNTGENTYSNPNFGVLF